MGDDAPFRNYYTDFRAEDRTTKTMLGGMRFASRIRLFLFIGLLALVGLGGLLFVADQRAANALNEYGAAQRLAGLISRIETGSLETHSDSRNFFLSRDVRYADNYQKRSEPLLANLERLYGLPRAEGVRKHVATVNDGVAQHASQFGKVVEIQKVLGLDERSGLVKLTQNSVTALEAKISTLKSPDLSRRLADIRATESNILAAAAPEAVKRITTQLENFKQALSASSANAANKTATNLLIESYQTDISQYARTRAALRQEIGRLGEINTYMSPSLAALITFGNEFVAGTDVKLTAVQQLLRQLLAGGIAGVVIILIGVGWLMLRSMSGPLSELATAATRLAHGDRGVAIPALGNYDETGEVANALTFFRENMAQADRLRKELEENLEPAKSRAIPEPVAPPPPSLPAPDEEPAPRPSPATALVPSGTPNGFVTTPISEISQRVTQTSQNASVAAFEAERTETMVNGLAAAAEKMSNIQRLVSTAGDMSSLLAVQTAIDHETAARSDDNLIVLQATNSGEDAPRADAGQSAEGRAAEILTSIKAAGAELEELDRIIGRVNEVAIEFAAEASTHALDSATELLRQSEDLRGMLDDLLGKIRLDERGARRPDSESGEG